MKKMACTLVINTSWGYVLTPRRFESVREAQRAGRESWGFAFRIFDDAGREIRRGYCR